MLNAHPVHSDRHDCRQCHAGGTHSHSYNRQGDREADRRLCCRHVGESFFPNHQPRHCCARNSKPCGHSACGWGAFPTRNDVCKFWRRDYDQLANGKRRDRRGSKHFDQPVYARLDSDRSATRHRWTGDHGGHGWRVRDLRVKRVSSDSGRSPDRLDLTKYRPARR